MPPRQRRSLGYNAIAAAVLSVILSAEAVGAQDMPSPFVQSLASAAAEDDAVAAYYAARGYRTLWTGPEDAARRALVLAAFATAADHGLPVSRYDAGALAARFASAQTEGDRGRLEVAMTRAYLAFAHDLQSGALVPKTVDSGILREVTVVEPAVNLAAAEGPDFAAYLRELPPDAPEYARLMATRFELEQVVASDGWGATVVSGGLGQGDRGAAVVALRDRLGAMGYLGRTATAVYDRDIASAVSQFQIDHGLPATGKADAETLAEINESPEARLQAVTVALERLRWMGDAPRGDRYVWVNQPDFTARIMDHGKVTFQTRAVIGKDTPDQRSPEFSDEMEYMVVNPSWGVPRSITVKEYLPLLQRNPNAVGHLQVVDSRGRVIPRGSVNFAAYSARSFPFGLRQPPSDGNALGKVKFMFPNPYNIYLHDTPSKSLFEKQVRAFSHGCIRLGEPFDFAYTLLAPQAEDPKGTFEESLNTGRETVVKLETHIPVHLVYFTAWPTPKGRMTYRNDVYGRDQRIWDALVAAGLEQTGAAG
jgi:murein L,D-transpeptidase YcbB/YkuD